MNMGADQERNTEQDQVKRFNKSGKPIVYKAKKLSWEERECGVKYRQRGSPC